MLATLTNGLVFATEAGGEEEGGSFLVSPGIGLMVWTLFLFGVSMFILWQGRVPAHRARRSTGARRRSRSRSTPPSARARRPTSCSPSTASA